MEKFEHGDRVVYIDDHNAPHPDLQIGKVYIIDGTCESGKYVTVENVRHQGHNGHFPIYSSRFVSLEAYAKANPTITVHPMAPSSNEGWRECPPSPVSSGLPPHPSDVDSTDPDGSTWRTRKQLF